MKYKNILVCANFRDNLWANVATSLKRIYCEDFIMASYSKPTFFNQIDANNFIDLCDLNNIHNKTKSVSHKKRNIKIWSDMEIDQYKKLRDIFYQSASRCGIHYRKFFDREHTFKIITERIFSLIDKYQLKIIVFDVVPHLPWELLLWEAVRIRGGHSFCFRRAGIGDAIYIEEEIYGHCSKPFNQCSNSHPITLLEEERLILEYIQRLDFTKHQDGGKWNDNQHNKGVIKRLKSKVKTILNSNRLFYYLFYSIKTGLKIKYKPYLKADRNSREITYSSIFPVRTRLGIFTRNIIFGFDQYLNELSMRKYIKKCNIKNTKYIYFPLHMQPEATTIPLGFKWTDQVSAIEYLSQSFPSYKILVKEHPNQYRYDFRKEKVRSKLFYERISSISNVILVELNLNSIYLTENSSAVAGISGSNQWEAVIRYKPIIQFSEQIFSKINYCLNINENDHEQMEKRLQSIINLSEKEKLSSLTNFIRTCRDIFIQAGLYQKYLDIFMDSDTKKASENIISSIQDIINR